MAPQSVKSGRPATALRRRLSYLYRSLQSLAITAMSLITVLPHRRIAERQRTVPQQQHSVIVGIGLDSPGWLLYGRLLYPLPDIDDWLQVAVGLMTAMTQLYTA